MCQQREPLRPYPQAIEAEKEEGSNGKFGADNWISLQQTGKHGGGGHRKWRSL